jgi:outer membrane autotransporter protein
MSPASFRKTILAIAVTAALPAYAQTLVLTNSGIEENDETFSEIVEITGSFTSSDSDLDAIEFNSTVFEKDLILNATINANGDNANGVDLSTSADDEGPFTSFTQISGDLVNKGNISVTGGGVAAMLVDPAAIGGNLVNEGTLSAKGELFEGDGVRALEFSGDSWNAGDLINAESGRIIAEGENAKGILLEGSGIGGSLINRGKIQVSGANASAIDATTNEWWNESELESERSTVETIENSGEITATGQGAKGIQLDGVGIDRIVNSGTIQADGTAILIDQFDKLSDDYDEHFLLIDHRGGLISGTEAAINAMDGKVDLLWSGGTIKGNILGLGGFAKITGEVVFDGTTFEVGEDEFVRVGADGKAGHLKLEQAHTTINGDLKVAGDSSLSLNLSSATDANKAVLKVTNIAQFESGAKLVLVAKGQDFSANGTSYRLVEANQIIDNGLQVISSSQLLKVSDLNIGSTSISGGLATTDTGGEGSDTDDSGSTPPDSGSDQTGTVEIISKTPTEFMATIASGGGSTNAQQAAGAFTSVAKILAQSDVNDPIVQAFDSITEAQAAKLAEQLTPEVNGGSTTAAVSGQTLISNVTGSRTSSVRGQSSGEHFKEAGVWVQALYSDAEQNLRDGVAGYNAYSRGLAVGADGKVTDQLTVGLAYSFLDTKVNGNTGNRTDVEGHAFTLYSGLESGNAFVDGSLTYGINDNSGKRQIAGTTAKGDYDSELLGLNLVGGYTYRIDSNLLIEPRLAARYSNVQIDSYREKGSSAALQVEDQRYEVFELGAGVRVAGSYPLGQGTLEPQAKLMAYHDFAADQASSTSTFVLGNTPFVTRGAKPVRNSYEAGVGVDYRLGAVTLGASYDYVGKSGFNADTFLAKVRYDF